MHVSNSKISNKNHTKHPPASFRRVPLENMREKKPIQTKWRWNVGAVRVSLISDLPTHWNRSILPVLVDDACNFFSQNLRTNPIQIDCLNKLFRLYRVCVALTLNYWTGGFSETVSVYRWLMASASLVTYYNDVQLKQGNDVIALLSFWNVNITDLTTFFFCVFVLLR